MITYQVDIGIPSAELRGDDELYRIEFHAPVLGADGQVYDDVLIWIDNMTRQDAEDLERSIREGRAGRQIFCRYCPAGTIPEPHEHDSSPEERGWRFRDITRFRLMPMREAV